MVTALSIRLHDWKAANLQHLPPTQQVILCKMYYISYPIPLLGKGQSKYTMTQVQDVMKLHGESTRS